MTTSQMIGTAATVYGFAASLTVLLQARQLLQRGSSCDVSGRFLASYVGGYGIWLAYGLSTQSVPIVVVHAVGLVAGIVTLAVALHLRGSLLRPASWNSCDGDPAPPEGRYRAGPKPGARSSLRHHSSRHRADDRQRVVNTTRCATRGVPTPSGCVTPAWTSVPR